MMTLDTMLEGLKNIFAELPLLIGKEAWASLRDNFQITLAKLDQSTNPAERSRHASSLVDIIATHDRARERLRNEIALIHFRREIQTITESELPIIAVDLRMESNVVAVSVEAALRALVLGSGLRENFDKEVLRLVKIKEGGLEGGKSIKLKNLRLDSGMLMELCAASIVTADKLLVPPHPHPLIVVAGILLILRALQKAMTVQISEREASVFWGLIGAQNEAFYPSKQTVVEHTNQARAKYGLGMLTDDQIASALKKLEELRCVRVFEDKPNTWRIVEQYEIEY